MTSVEESKYAHLLQPIRDLAGNWDINVADELEEYLEVLENVTFSFEDGPSLNFAEAALVIQGSACVYSKKVEYLHSLVIQALKFMSEKSRRPQEKSTDNEHQADEEGGNDAEEDHFAVLEDFWQGEEDIDLDRNAQTQPAQASKPPAIIVALTDSGVSAGDGDAGNYRVSKCIVHCSGALMLDPADVVRYNHHLESQHDQMSNHTSQQDTVRQPSMSHPGLFGIPSHDQPLGDGDMPESMEAPGNAGAYPHLQPGGNEEMLASGWQDQGMDDDDDNGAGDMDHYVADGNGAENASGPHGCLPMEAGDGDRQLRSGIQAAQPASAQAGPDADSDDGEEEIWDPYAPLDPSKPGDLPIAPFKKGRAPSNRRRRRKHKAEKVPSGPGPLSGLSLGNVLPPHAHPHRLTFSEFAYALQAGTESSKRSRKAKPDRWQHEDQAMAAARLTEGQPCKGSNAAQLSAFEPMASQAQPHEHEAFDAGPDDYGHHDVGDGDMGPADDDSEHGEAPDMASLELAATWTGSQWPAEAPGGPASDAMLALDSQVPSYEDLCRAHIEAFIDAAAAAELQTELAARVGEWQGKVGVLLDEQDARPAFDLQASGSNLLDRLSDLSLREDQDLAAGEACRPVAFGEVVEGQQRHEVARSFSALLQLINNGNVQLNQGLTTASPFSLQLQSLELQQDHMDQRGAAELILSRDASKASLALCKAEGVDILPAAGLQAARKAPHKRKKKQIADPST